MLDTLFYYGIFELTLRYSIIYSFDYSITILYLYVIRVPQTVLRYYPRSGLVLKRPLRASRRSRQNKSPVVFAKKFETSRHAPEASSHETRAATMFFMPLTF